MLFLALVQFIGSSVVVVDVVDVDDVVVETQKDKMHDCVFVSVGHTAQPFEATIDTVRD